MSGAEALSAMRRELDPFESAARIVEAFAAGASEGEVELLKQIASAIRDRAVDD